MQSNLICKNHGSNGRRFSAWRDKLAWRGYFSRVLFQFTCWLTLASSVSTAAVIYGAEGNPTGNPMGGSAGYNNMVMPFEADYTVENKLQLLSALAEAKAGQIIYIKDHAEINLTGERGIEIPGKVSLAFGPNIGDVAEFG